MHWNYLRFPGGKAKAFTLSYDDGVVQDVHLIELMEQYGVKGTFNLNSGLYKKKDAETAFDEWHIRLSQEVALSLYSRPCAEVAVHGYSHAHIGELPQSVITRELLNDRCNLEANFNKIVYGACYPYGCFNDKVRLSATASGILYARGCSETHEFYLPNDWHEWKPTCQHSDIKLDELTDEFIISAPSRAPMLFYVWGHSYQFDKDNNWGVAENLFKRLSNEKDIWFATNGEIYEYVNAFNSLRYSGDGLTVYNPSAFKIYFMCNYEPINIEPNQTLTLPKYKE